MPLIRGIQMLSDRVVLDTPRGERPFTFNRISQQTRNQGAAAVTAFCNAWLNDPANGVAQDADGRHFHIEVAVLTVNPLLLNVIVSNQPITAAQRADAVSQD